ncbi:MAG: hypothetical protein J07HQW1_00257 [Haloquadratum walsbyi J07HQW1]|uniref:Capsule biosynthesis CapC n=1 Tax=Haloquadratum walsbyi J07HQW1 TaxID=1238424 RepID=U1MKV4_9EURY|nr:MAG: hypothetical protein J07HQW1_00257 [Haloquadratum walsbyi J07HQW1]
MIIGLSLVAVISQVKGYRLGGVMVLPILAIYTLREPLSIIIFILGTVAAWCSLWALQEHTLSYGRRLFLSAIIAGVIATIVMGYILSVTLPSQLSFTHGEAIASIFPGIMAYNFMREDPENRRGDLRMMCYNYLMLVAIGAISLWVFAEFNTLTPPFLRLPTSDITNWIRIEPRGGAYPKVIPSWIVLMFLPVAVLIYEGFRQRYDHRLVGIIILPALCLFSVQSTLTILIYVTGATITFYITGFIHRMTLLYGRVLLTISILLGTVYSLIAGIIVSNSVSGVILFFTGLFIGIGSYNLNRVSRKTRVSHVRIDAGLFVVFYAFLFTLIDVPITGLLYDNRIFYLIVGVLIIALATIEMYRLEQSIPDPETFAGESIFAYTSSGDIDPTDSPLVADTDEDT